jgi:hypothetical protein
MNNSLIKLENKTTVVTIDAIGGAIANFHLKDNINPLSFAFTKEQMPANNKNGAPYQGHFLCLGRWGEPSAGEVKAGIPNHGHFANMPWTVQYGRSYALNMQATSHLEGLKVERTITLEEEHSVYTVKEVVQNINPLGRMFNMVQHPTLAAPFLDGTTIINCNACEGFDQALYKDASNNVLQWPYARDDKQNTIDLTNSQHAYDAVISFIVEKESNYGWITAYSPKHNLLLGYIWKRSDYPWIHLWQHYNEGTIQYRGIEFGTAGIHQPFNEIINTATSLFGEKTFVYIDAGEIISKSYCSFLHHTESSFEGVKSVSIENELIVVQLKDKRIYLKLPNQLHQ